MTQPSNPPADRPARIVVVGDLVTDVLAAPAHPLAHGSDTPAAIRISGGGSAANTAAWLVRTGADATLVAVVGTDPAGNQRLAELRADGVRCAVRRSDQAPTGAVVVLSAAGERTMLVQRGANALLSHADIDGALSEPAHHLHLSGYSLFDPATRGAARYALHRATELAMTTSVDAASADPISRLGAATVRDWISGVDLLLANSDEAVALLADDPGAADPASLATGLSRWCRWVVVKMGAAGALGATREGPVVAVPAAPARLVDSTGAGDAFAAGLLSAWLTGADHRTALTAGAAWGAKAVGQLGARPDP